MIVRLVLPETETAPDRELLARLALRHRMRVAGSGNCLEIPDSSRSYAHSVEAPSTGLARCGCGARTGLNTGGDGMEAALMFVAGLVIAAAGAGWVLAFAAWRAE